jgi:hypothetical protein
MTGKREHVEFEVLNDYVDGSLDAGTARRVEEHVAACGQCSAELTDLRTLLAGVAELPKSVLPADDIWADLKAEIDHRKEVVLPVLRGDATTTASPARGTPAWYGRIRLAAAAVFLVAASSAVTALVLRYSAPATYTARDVGMGAQIDPSNSPSVLPASFRAAEGKYVSTIDELRVGFEAQRSTLSPETVRTVDRSLALIDSAITEARAALVADPGNRTLVDLLSASYERKLDLLRRTSELSSRI